MAFPYLSENGFEDGTKGHFDTETDTENRLDFVHYSTLASIPGMPAPFRGAYAARVTLANDGSPADALLQETGSWDTAAAATIYFRLIFWVSPDITMADTDEFAIFQLWSGTNTAEGGAYINYTTASGLRLGIGETSASSFMPLTTGVWHQLEIKALIDSGVGNDGTLDAWLDGGAFAQVATLNQGDITSGVIGSIGQDAGTTKGTILFDSVVADDARIFPVTDRWPDSVLLTQSGHVFVGEGEVTGISLLSGGGTDNVLSVFDTDRAYTSDPANVVLELKNVANNEAVDSEFPLRIHRGCYVAMSGTAPRALVKIRWANSYSEGAVRQQGLRRTTNRFGA